MFGARLEVEPRLPRQHVEHAALSRDGVLLVAGKRRERLVITYATRVMKQLLDGDVARIVGQFRYVGPDPVAEAQLPVTFEEQNRQRRELLGKRRQIEHGPRSQRYPVFE